MKWGMVIDLDRCTACQACVAACRIENNVPFQGEEQIKKDGVRGINTLNTRPTQCSIASPPTKA